MSDILSAISGQFGKALILGTFAPVAVFVILATLVLVPLLPHGVPLVTNLAVLGVSWQIVAILLLAIILTLLLYNLNGPLIRVYEGYPWRGSGLSRFWTGRHQRQFEALQREHRRL